MLSSLSIRDFVLIEALDLKLQKGLIVLTGETGAGKSILLDALGAACGARAEAGFVRHGAEKASVTASFDLPACHPAYALLQEQEIDSADDGLILRRIISQDGRSKAFINDQAVSIGLLRQVGLTLVEVHGQFDTHGLLDPATHGQTLDRFGQHKIDAVKSAWHTWQTAQKAEAEARRLIAAAAAEEESLREALETLAKLAPQTGEEEKLLAHKQFLNHKSKLAEAFGIAYNALTQDRGAEGALATASKSLGKVVQQAGDKAQAALVQIDLARDAVANAASLIERLQDDVAGEGLSLDQVEDRLYELRSIARRHGLTPEELPALALSLAEKLSRLEQGEDNLKALEAANLAAQKTYNEAANALTLTRQKSGEKLAKIIMGELKPLKLERAVFSVQISPTTPSAAGMDQIQFMVSTNVGMPPAPLDRIASGGELARFMLAMKVALADTIDAVTLIFDEIDQGVGGAVATAVGERLARLGEDRQVMVVTHSPQVAAKGHAQLKVSKSVKADQTRTAITLLNAQERQEEIARMLAGQSITDASRHAALELLGQPSA